MRLTVKKFSGVIFFSLLYFINLITGVCPELDKFLIFLTIICLISPIIQKQNPFKKQQ
jgi:hypothetical protein